MYISISTASTSSSVATSIQWKINNDLTYEEIPMGTGTYGFVSYRDGVIAFSGRYGTGAGGEQVFMWSEDDGQTWTNKEIAGLQHSGYPFGIKGDGKFATVHNQNGWELYEFDPTTQSSALSDFDISFRQAKSLSMVVC